MTRIWVTPKTSLQVGTSIYAQGDALGAKQSVKAPPAGIIRGILITDADDEASVTVNVWIFETEPTGITANSGFSLGDADLVKVQAVHLVDTSFDAINGIAKFEECAIPYRIPDEDGLLHFQCELEGAATPTFAGTDDVKIQFFIEW